MQFRIFLALVCLVPNILSASDEPVFIRDERPPAVIDDKIADFDHVEYLFAINRPATEIEKRSKRTVAELPYEKYIAHVPEDPRQRLRMELIRREVEDQGLANKPFSIEYGEDKNFGTVDDIIISAGEKFYVVHAEDTSPRLEPLSADPLTVPSIPELQRYLEAKDFVIPTFRKRLITKILSMSLADIGCNSSSEFNRLADPNLKELFLNADIRNYGDFSDDVKVKPAIEEFAQHLDREGRLMAYERHQANNCVSPLYGKLWQILITQYRPTLLWDFKYWLTKVDAAKDKLKFSGTTHSHVADPGAPEIERYLKFAQELLSLFKPSEFAKTLPREFRHWALLDINTTSPSTRVELSNILIYYLGEHLFWDLHDRGPDQAVFRNEMISAAVRHRILPEAHPVKIFGSKSTTKVTDTDGTVNYKIFCAGAQMNLLGTFGSKYPTSNNLVSTFSMNEEELRTIREKKWTLPFKCGNETAKITVPIERLKANLQDPSEAKFIVGEDRKIKAVTTFYIIQAIDEKYFKRLRWGSATKGYFSQEVTEVDDLRKEYLEEMKDSDFYFPANHQWDSNEYGIGYTHGKKLRIKRRLNGITSEMVIFIPPYKVDGGSSAITLTSEEIANLFVERRKLEASRRLHVMNLACNSEKCIPHWLGAYKRSLASGLGEEDARTQARSYTHEVPVAIGAGISFDTNDIEKLVKYAEYPFHALDLATEEKSILDLMGYLETVGYKPGSSLGRDIYFDVKASENQILVNIETESGQTFGY